MNSLVAPLALQFGIDRSLDQSFQNTFKKHPGPILLAGLLYLSLSIASLFTIVGWVFLLPALTAGLFRFALGASDDRPRVEDLFLGFRDYGRSTLAFLGVGGLSALVMAPYIISIVVALKLSLPLLILPGLLVSMLGMALIPAYLVWVPFYLVDRGLSLSDALTAAWEVVRAQPWRALGAYYLPLVVLSVATIFPPVFLLAWPFVVVFWAITYRQVMPAA